MKQAKASDAESQTRNSRAERKTYKRREVDAFDEASGQKQPHSEFCIGGFDATTSAGS